MGTPHRPDHAVRALVVDAHETTRIGLAVLLRREPWISQCHLAADQGEAVVLARRHRPDVAVLDISNMGPFVALATSALRDAHPGIQIVLTSRCGGRATVPANAGAAGFLAPDTTAAEAVSAVRAAVLDGAAAPDRSPAAPDGAAGELTVRERQVLELMATGATNREIAAALHLGPDTIKKHATSLFRKLGVRNRTEAVQRALTRFV